MKKIILLLFSLLLCACPPWDEYDHTKNSIIIMNYSKDGKNAFFSVCSFNGSLYETLQNEWVSVRTDNILEFVFHIEEDSWKTAFLKHGWEAIYIYAFEDYEHFIEWKKENDDRWALKKYTFSIADIDKLNLDNLDKGFRDVWIYYPYDGIYNNNEPDSLKESSRSDHFGNK